MTHRRLLPAVSSSSTRTHYRLTKQNHNVSCILYKPQRLRNQTDYPGAPKHPSSRETIRQRNSRPDVRLPRPALKGTVRGQRLGGTVATGGAPDGLEHAPTIPRGVSPNRSTSVASTVVNLPRQQTPFLRSGSCSFSSKSNRMCVRTLP